MGASHTFGWLSKCVVVSQALQYAVATEAPTMGSHVIQACHIRARMDRSASSANSWHVLRHIVILHDNTCEKVAEVLPFLRIDGLTIGTWHLHMLSQRDARNHCCSKISLTPSILTTSTQRILDLPPTQACCKLQFYCACLDMACAQQCRPKMNIQCTKLHSAVAFMYLRKCLTRGDQNSICCLQCCMRR